MTLQFVSVFTLADITPQPEWTRVRDSNKIEYHQQQNYNVLLQTIGLRTQVMDATVEQLDELSALWMFSSLYDHYEKTNVWRLRFGFESPQVWSDGVDELALLREDVHGVAFTPDLNNTVEFPSNIFDTKVNVNTYFMMS